MVKLFKHQLDALRKTEGRMLSAYYLSMGLGKSYIGSEKVMALGLKTLCVCQKSKIDDWYKQFVDNYDVKVYDLTKGINEFLKDSSLCVGIINYDLLFRRPELMGLSNFTLLLDESSLIQNKKAKRSDFIMSMRPSAVILLSGTPGKIDKLYTQCRLLGWNISQSEYDRRYCNYRFVDYHIGHLVRELSKTNPYKNIDDLHNNLIAHGAVFMTTEDAGVELPEQQFIDIKLERSKEYNQFLKDKVIILNDEELAGDNGFKNYLYKRRLCSVYNKEKLNALKDLIDSTDDRLIIFYNFDLELKVLKDLLKDRPISEVNGHNKNLANYENLNNSVTLVQYQAGSMGLNLQKANKTIYFSPTDKSENWQQSLKRTHRINQVNKCIYYRLIVKNSIEEKIYESLERDEDFNYRLFTED